MSILSASPTNTRMFDAEIAAALKDINAAVIVQQLNYWINKDGVGTVINGVKYVYNTFVDWVNQQFPWLSVWQFRKAMSLLRGLGIVKVIRHKARQWNQTNFYTLDSDRLVEFLGIETATSTEIFELCNSSSQDKEIQQIEVRDTKVSLYGTKNTPKEERQSNSAASPSKVNKVRSNSPKSKSNRVKSSVLATQQNKSTCDTEPIKSEDKSSVFIERTINNKWQKQIEDLDNAGIPANKTLIELLKTYKSEEIADAIALFEIRKQSHYIPNPCGYFTEALKQKWARKCAEVSSAHFLAWCGKNALTGDLSNVDKKNIFRHWYDLAKELGYCSGQEVRNEEQWICLSGSWEKWSNAVERGYSLDYLKKTIQRSRGRQ